MAAASSGSSDRSVLLRPRRDGPTTGAIWSKRQRPGRAAGIARNTMRRCPISSVTEEFHGYPGLQLMAALKEARRRRRCGDVACAVDADHAGADDALVPPACRRLECE